MIHGPKSQSEVNFPHPTENSARSCFLSREQDRKWSAMFTPLFPNMSLSIDLHPLHGPASTPRESLRIPLKMHRWFFFDCAFKCDHGPPPSIQFLLVCRITPPPKKSLFLFAGGCANLCVTGPTHPWSSNLLPSKMRRTNPQIPFVFSGKMHLEFTSDCKFTCAAASPSRILIFKGKCASQESPKSSKAGRKPYVDQGALQVKGMSGHVTHTSQNACHSSK